MILDSYFIIAQNKDDRSIDFLVFICKSQTNQNILEI